MLYYRFDHGYNDVFQIDRTAIDWDVRAVQIAPWQRDANSIVLGCADLQLIRFQAHDPYIAHARPPVNTIQIYVYLPTDHLDVIWNGVQIKGPAIALAGGSQRHHFISRGHVNCIVLEVNREALKPYDVLLAHADSLMSPQPIDDKDALQMSRMFDHTSSFFDKETGELKDIMEDDFGYNQLVHRLIIYVQNELKKYSVHRELSQQGRAVFTPYTSCWSGMYVLELFVKGND